MQQDSSDFEDRDTGRRRHTPFTSVDALALPEQRSLHDVVAERLMAAIADGELGPGQRLVELKLASRLGVSRAPLREALKQLEANGIVESRRGRGTYVRSVSTAELEQMMTVRATLEGLAARLCATQADEEQRAELRRVHSGIEVAARRGDTEGWRRIQWEFHELVCRFSGNAVLLRSWLGLSTLVRVFVNRRRGLMAEPEIVLAHHRDYLSAIMDRDGDRAEWLFRATTMADGYIQLGRDVPAALQSFVSRNQADPARAGSPNPWPASAAVAHVNEAGTARSGSRELSTNASGHVPHSSASGSGKR